ncbi:PH domain-containing protein, partial [Dietzia cercidiphylli]
PLQRRAGLATLVATTAGGSGAFRLPDVGREQAPALWRTAGPVWDHLAEPPGSRRVVTNAAKSDTRPGKT